MTEPDRDQLYARVFATMSARHLLDDLAERGKRSISLADLEARVARARKSWATRAPVP